MLSADSSERKSRIFIRPTNSERYLANGNENNHRRENVKMVRQKRANPLGGRLESGTAANISLELRQARNMLSERDRELSAVCSFYREIPGLSGSMLCGSSLGGQSGTRTPFNVSCSLGSIEIQRKQNARHNQNKDGPCQMRGLAKCSSTFERIWRSGAICEQGPIVDGLLSVHSEFWLNKTDDAISWLSAV